MSPDAPWDKIAQSAEPHAPLLDAALRQIAAAIDRTAEFSLAGRRKLEDQLVRNLADRQRIQSLVGESVGLAPVLFIIGPPRTGTTLLQQLLALDPRARFLQSWETEQPFPAPRRASYRTDPRIQAAAERMQAARAASPGLFNMHPMGETLPTEDVALLSRGFLPGVWKGTILDRDFEDWSFANADALARMAYAYHRAELGYLQSDFDPDHWVLKSPGHTFGLPALLDIYPNALILNTFRDPSEWLASQFRLQWLYRSGFGETDKAELADSSMSWWSRGMAQLIQARQDRPERFISIDFRQMIRAPMETVEQIYADAGSTLSEDYRAHIAEFLAHDRFEEEKTYTTSLEDFDVTEGDVDRIFGQYIEEFKLR